MQSQKKIKFRKQTLKDSQNPKEKPTSTFYQHHSQSIHIRSVSKDTTPQKNTQPLYQPLRGLQTSIKKKNKSKHLTSVCSKSKHLTSVHSYSAMDRDTLPNTKRKRKFSSFKSSDKKKSVNTTHKNMIQKKMGHDLKLTNKNFDVLAKCLSEFVKEEKKVGKNPTKQILQFIKAFNTSEIGSISKDLQVLIGSILNCIENNVQPIKQKIATKRHVKTQCFEGEISQEQIQDSENKPSQTQIAYSQFFQKNQSLLPPTIKKRAQLRKESSSSSDSSPESKQYIEIKKPKSPKQKQDIEEQLQEDVRQITRQLEDLKIANNRLLQEAANRNSAKKNLQIELQEQQKIMRFLNSKQRGGDQAQFKRSVDYI